MSLIVGSARANENGKSTGGKAGDQTKREVSTQAYYMHSKGWLCLRAKDEGVADALADAMLQACQNDNIGYCQTHRTSVIAQLKKSGSLAKINSKTETDCSVLVRACCVQAGFDPGNFTTANEAAILKKSGRFKDVITVTASTKLYNGDILVTRTKGHTVIVVSGNPRAKSGGGSGTSTPSKVDAAQKMDASLAGTYTVTASALNLRSGAGTSKTVLKTIPKGSTVKCYGYYSLDGSTKWLYVDYNGTTGYVSQRYLQCS